MILLHHVTRNNIKFWIFEITEKSVHLLPTSRPQQKHPHEDQEEKKTTDTHMQNKRSTMMM